MSNHHLKRSPILLIALCALSSLTQAASDSACGDGFGSNSVAAKLVKRASEIRSELRPVTEPVRKCTDFIETILEYALAEGLIDGSDDSSKSLGKLIQIAESRAECFQKSSSRRSQGLKRLIWFMSSCVSLVQSDVAEVRPEVVSPPSQLVASSPVSSDLESSEQEDLIERLVEVNKELTKHLELATGELELRLKSEKRCEREQTLELANQNLGKEIRFKDDKINEDAILIKELREKVQKLEANAGQAAPTGVNSAANANTLELRNCRDTLGQLKEASRREADTLKGQINELVAKERETSSQLAKLKSTQVRVNEVRRSDTLGSLRDCYNQCSQR